MSAAILTFNCFVARPGDVGDCRSDEALRLPNHDDLTGAPRKELPMIVINMPGGAVQEIDEDELLWFRKAFASEWRGATMILLASDRLYSIEDLSELTEKFSTAEVPLAEFSAPDARLKVVVNAERVRNVIESNPEI